MNVLESARESQMASPFESDGQLLIENDDEDHNERILDTTIPPPVFASEHVMPKSSIYEVSAR